MDYMAILKEYWGIIFVTIFLIGLYFYNKKQAIKVAKALIIQAEKYSEQYALNNGKDKFDWVSENGYKMLPPVAKLFISAQAFEMIIQYTFDKLIDWAEENNNLS